MKPVEDEKPGFRSGGGTIMDTLRSLTPPKNAHPVHAEQSGQSSMRGYTTFTYAIDTLGHDPEDGQTKKKKD